MDLRFREEMEKLRKVLTEIKKPITENISNVKELLIHHRAVLSEGDIQKIDRDFDRHGRKWALDTFVDCIKCRGSMGFKEFMKFLQENDYEELLQICKQQCLHYDLCLRNYVQPKRHSSAPYLSSCCQSDSLGKFPIWYHLVLLHFAPYCYVLLFL